MADVGISVETAADVAKEAADFVLLPLWLLASLVGLTLVYVAAAEVAKKLFFRKFTD